MMKALMAAAALALGALPAAAADGRAIAAEAAGLAREIGGGIGRVHDADAARRSPDVVLEGLGSWCTYGGLRSLSPRGEESLLYLDLLDQVREQAARVRLKETLLGQAAALGAAGADAAPLERDLTLDRAELARRETRAEALRRMLLGSGWAQRGADGALHLAPVEGVDLAPASACSGGYDGPG